MEFKYVITDNDCFAIFSPTTEHRDVARGLWGKPVGAGFCTIMPVCEITLEGESMRDNEYVSVHCYGDCHSLKLASRMEDERIINQKINNR